MPFFVALHHQHYRVVQGASSRYRRGAAVFLDMLQSGVLACASAVADFCAAR
jgi:hypothetical protein